MKNVGTCVTRCKIQQFLTGSWNFAWLLVGYSLVARSCSAAVFRCCMRYSIKEDTDLDTDSGVLPEEFNFFLHL